jgi:hypothetical protein
MLDGVEGMEAINTCIVPIYWLLIDPRNRLS